MSRPSREEYHRLLPRYTYRSQTSGGHAIEWLELLSASAEGEDLRQEAREETRKFEYLQSGARHYHSEVCRAHIQEAAQTILESDLLESPGDEDPDTQSPGDEDPDTLKLRAILALKELSDQDRSLAEEPAEEAQTMRATMESLQQVASQNTQRASLLSSSPLEEEMQKKHSLRRVSEFERVLDGRAQGGGGILHRLSGRENLDKLEKLLPTQEKHGELGPWLWCHERWVKELNKLTPMRFAWIVTALSSEEGDQNLRVFIRSLSLELPARSAHCAFNGVSQTVLGVGRWEWKKLSGQGFRLLGLDARTDIYSGHPRDILQKQVSQMECQAVRESPSMAWAMSGDSRAVYKTTFCITPAVQLLQDSISDYDLTLVLKSLVDTGHFSYTFVTPVGRAVLELACGRAMVVRRIHALKDTLYVIVLARMGHALRQGDDCPDWAIFTFILLAVVVAFNFFSKLIIESCFFISSDSRCCSGFLAAVRKHATTWNLLVVCSEVFSIWVTLRFVKFWWHVSVSSPQQYWDFFESEPSAMSSLVLIRWTILATNFLQIEQVGRNMVPVVIAVCRPASIFFLLFLGFMICGAFHAYYVFPIEENVSHGGSFADNANHVLNTFLKIFRLAVLGDFDLSELEGLSDKISAKMDPATHMIKGEVDVDSSDWAKKYHRTIRYEFVVLSLVITVVVMNVYVGLLGELYQKAERRCRQLYNNYRASCAYRHMCERYAFRWLLFSRCCRSQQEDADSLGLYWLSYSKTKLHDTEDDDDY